jgi:Ca2+-binding EF-hand superfamily protein
VFGTDLFELMDRDGDGKLFEEEMNEFLEREEDLAQGQTVLTVAEQGPSLFDVLDEDRDQRLGVREMRKLIERFPAWDRNHDDRLGAEEITRHFRLGYGRGQSMILRGRIAIANNVMVSRADASAAVKGPTWFQKMDRNHDGDLSRREFLGSLADFHRLDADHDGLLDPSEAAGARD